MSDYSLHVPASASRRTGAFIANCILLSLPDTAFRLLGFDRQGILDLGIAVLAILAFCVVPESPGKRLLSLTILNEKKEPVGTKLRIWRAMPYMIFFAVLPFSQFLENMAVKVTVSLVFMLALIFMAANALTMFFSPDSRSLLDMKLGTRVFTPMKMPGIERPKIFGVRVW